MNSATAMLKVATMNVAWAGPTTKNGIELRDRIWSGNPDVVVLTETTDFGWHSTGHEIAASADYGYPLKDGRRKVLAWSKQPWRQVDQCSDPAMPAGRFVSAVTDTPIGPIPFIAVCIPWHAAHVSTGKRDRKMWQEHLAFLRSLQHVIEATPGPVILAGDFNQQVPRTRAPNDVFEALRSCLESLDVYTAGFCDAAGKDTIDHIAGRGFACANTRLISNHGDTGKLISDHLGVAVELEAQPIGNSK